MFDTCPDPVQSAADRAFSIALALEHRSAVGQKQCSASGYDRSLPGMSLARPETHLQTSTSRCARPREPHVHTRERPGTTAMRGWRTVRTLYVIGLFYVGVAAYALWRGPPPPADPIGYTTVDVGSTGWQWFQRAKPYCNTLEVATIHRRNPPPNNLEGAGFSAACYALAANLEESRSIIMGLEPGERWRAAGIVFDIGHPVADMGDDRSAGPIMELVVEFWPNHYQALYHAGASNYALGRYDRARRYLQDFLAHYDVDDGFSRNARSILERLRTQ